MHAKNFYDLGDFPINGQTAARPKKVRDTWEVRKLNTALDERLFQEKNTRLVEQLFLDELALQRRKKEDKVVYDPVNGCAEKIPGILETPFVDILGIGFPGGKRYYGNLGRMMLQARLVLDTIKDHRPYDYRTGEGGIHDIATELRLLHRLVLKNLTNSCVGEHTNVDQPSLHEAVITQAHESYHTAARPRLRWLHYDVRSSGVVQEGGARHFQVMINDNLAKSTGDERYRSAARELVLTDVAPLYFDMCQRFGRRPIVQQEEFMREAEQYVREKDREALIKRRFFGPNGSRNMPNEYAEGYALFKLAEAKYEPREIHRAILNNDPSLLLE